MKHSNIYKRAIFQCIVFMCIIMVNSIVLAVEPVPVKPENEKRYHALLTELRCLVCQNQTIAESNSELAHDLRTEVNKMLNNGASNSEIIDFMADRYGDFVLYKPLVKPKTYLLWFGPFVFLVLILLLVLVFVRKQKLTVNAELSESEKNKLNSILDNKED